MCGQNVGFCNVKPGGTYSDHWALKELVSYLLTLRVKFEIIFQVY